MARLVFFPQSRLLWESTFCILVLAGKIVSGADLTVRVTQMGSDTPIADAVVTLGSGR